MENYRRFVVTSCLFACVVAFPWPRERKKQERSITFGENFERVNAGNRVKRCLYKSVSPVHPILEKTNAKRKSAERAPSFLLKRETKRAACSCDVVHTEEDCEPSPNPFPCPTAPPHPNVHFIPIPETPPAQTLQQSIPQQPVGLSPPMVNNPPSIGFHPGVSGGVVGSQNYLPPVVQQPPQNAPAPQTPVIQTEPEQSILLPIPANPPNQLTSSLGQTTSFSQSNANLLNPFNPFIYNPNQNSNLGVSTGGISRSVPGNQLVNPSNQIPYQNQVLTQGNVVNRPINPGTYNTNPQTNTPSSNNPTNFVPNSPTPVQTPYQQPGISNQAVTRPQYLNPTSQPIPNSAPNSVPNSLPNSATQVNRPIENTVHPQPSSSGQPSQPSVAHPVSVDQSPRPSEIPSPTPKPSVNSNTPPPVNPTLSTSAPSKSGSQVHNPFGPNSGNAKPDLFPTLPPLNNPVGPSTDGVVLPSGIGRTSLVGKFSDSKHSPANETVLKSKPLEHKVLAVPGSISSQPSNYSKSAVEEKGEGKALSLKNILKNLLHQLSRHGILKSRNMSSSGLSGKTDDVKEAFANHKKGDMKRAHSSKLKSKKILLSESVRSKKRSEKFKN